MRGEPTCLARLGIKDLTSHEEWRLGCEMSEPARAAANRLESKHAELQRTQYLSHTGLFEFKRLAHLTKKFDQKDTEMAPKILVVFQISR